LPTTARFWATGGAREQGVIDLIVCVHDARNAAHRLPVPVSSGRLTATGRRDPETVPASCPAASTLAELPAGPLRPGRSTGLGHGVKWSWLQSKFVSVSQRPRNSDRGRRRFPGPALDGQTAVTARDASSWILMIALAGEHRLTATAASRTASGSSTPSPRALRARGRSRSVPSEGPAGIRGGCHAEPSPYARLRRVRAGCRGARLENIQRAWRRAWVTFTESSPVRSPASPTPAAAGS